MRRSANDWRLWLLTEDGDFDMAYFLMDELNIKFDQAKIYMVALWCAEVNRIIRM